MTAEVYGSLGFWSSAVENAVLLGHVAAPWLFGY
jgi:hypothetical protein